jgi:hypothetical protein
MYLDYCVQERVREKYQYVASFSVVGMFLSISALYVGFNFALLNMFMGVVFRNVYTLALSQCNKFVLRFCNRLINNCPLSVERVAIV